MAKFHLDNADVLQTLYNVPLSAALAVALNHCSSNFRYGGRKRLFSRKQSPMLIFDGQFQTYAVFSYLLYDNDDNVTNCVMINVKKSMVHASFYSSLSF